MVPADDRLPDVLPTERLTASAMPVPELRAELRRIANVRNVGSVALTWVHAARARSASPCGSATRSPTRQPSCAWAQSSPASPSSATRPPTSSCSRTSGSTTGSGRWLLAYPGFVPLEAYRRGHFAHHKEEFGPNEPDMNLYVGYPITRPASAASCGATPGAARAGRTSSRCSPPCAPVTPPDGLRILAAQVALVAPSWRRPSRALPAPVAAAVDDLVAGHQPAALDRRARRDGASQDRRRTTHHVRQSWLARFWIVPLNTGWHLAHHVDMGVPWRNLPKLHAELVAAGMGHPRPGVPQLSLTVASSGVGRRRLNRVPPVPCTVSSAPVNGRCRESQRWGSGSR
jgi:hypothetical protein